MGWCRWSDIKFLTLRPVVWCWSLDFRLVKRIDVNSSYLDCSSDRKNILRVGAFVGSINSRDPRQRHFLWGSLKEWNYRPGLFCFASLWFVAIFLVAAKGRPPLQRKLCRCRRLSLNPWISFCRHFETAFCRAVQSQRHPMVCCWGHLTPENTNFTYFLGVVQVTLW